MTILRGKIMETSSIIFLVIFGIVCILAVMCVGVLVIIRLLKVFRILIESINE
jgi:hypothetical protein